MANEICFRTLHLDKPWTLKTYESAGGYAQWRKILKEKAVTRVVEVFDLPMYASVTLLTRRSRGTHYVRRPKHPCIRRLAFMTDRASSSTCRWTPRECPPCRATGARHRVAA